MKAAFAATLLAAVVNAQATTTKNDCLMGEGGEMTSTCTSLFYKLCRKFNIEQQNTCNIYTGTNTSLEWLTSDITVQYWEYEQLTDGCTLKDPAPKQYTSETQIFLGVGICNYKFQISNNSAEIAREITVLTDNAATLASTALATMAYLLF